MNTIKVFEEDWVGIVNQEIEYECREFAEIKNAIDNLNGINKTLVILETSETEFLTIGGGNDGRYICYLTQNGKMHNLINQAMKGKEKIEIVAGGQKGLYAPELCVTYEEIIEAASFFCANRGMSHSLMWEEQL